jgi:2-keto-4-pentenoate hydratase/2-oxohepta-3-ene-1,7-dioic acid hydratase in catechol pathway
MYSPVLVSYRSADSQPWRYAVRHDSRLADFTALGFNGSMRDLLEGGESRVKDLLRQASQNAKAWTEVNEATVFGPPIPDPDKILCIGLNYREHARESGLNEPPVPIVFAKFRNSLIGPGTAIQLPQISSQVDYEGELAVIIAKRCKHVPVSEGLSVVAGYAVFNDVSARDLQLQVSQWTIGKAVDTFAPIGPGIVPSYLVSDPQQLELITRLNGEVVQHASTSDMIFTVAEIIAHLTQAMTLEPGDVVATGTPSGVGFSRQPARFLKAGDVVEIEISGVGVLSNPVT